PVAHRECAAGLDLEQGGAGAAGDPLELRPERARAVALAPRQRHVLQKAVLGEALVELLVRQEPVVASVLFARAAGPRRRRNGELELGNALGEPPCKRAFPFAGGPGYDEDGTSG